MSVTDWIKLNIVHSLDDLKGIALSNGVCQCRINNLKASTKYSLKCSQYRKYPLCNYELKATVPYEDPHSIMTMSTLDDFSIWLQSCWLVVPLESCTCPVGLKVYSCKHSVGLAILFNLYQVSDKTRVQPLGKRKGKGRPKKVSTAYNK